MQDILGTAFFIFVIVGLISLFVVNARKANRLDARLNLDDNGDPQINSFPVETYTDMSNSRKQMSVPGFGK